MKTKKILLPDQMIPAQWYNIVADMPQKPLPPLDPQKPLLVFSSHSHEDHFDGKVFGLLEAHQDKRIRGQYSEQFASIYQYMHAHFRDSGLSLTALAEEFGMSVSTLSREFQKNLGQGFLDSLHQMRIEEAKYAIENTNASLNDIAISVGYTNTLTMTRAFKKYLGCTPGSFRKKEDIS